MLILCIPEPGCWPAVFVKTMVCWGCSFSWAQKTWLWSLLFKVFRIPRHKEAAWSSSSGVKFARGCPGFKSRSDLCGPFLERPDNFSGPKSHLWNCQPLVLKADLLTCFQGTKEKINCEVGRIKCSPFLRENCDTRKWPVKFRDLRETGPWFGFFSGCPGFNSTTLCKQPTGCLLPVGVLNHVSAKFLPHY